MISKLASVVSAFMLLGMLSACGQKQTTPSIVPETSPAVESELPSQETQKPTDEIQLWEVDGYLFEEPRVKLELDSTGTYTNEEYGFSVTLDESWTEYLLLTSGAWDETYKGEIASFDAWIRPALDLQQQTAEEEGWESPGFDVWQTAFSVYAVVPDSQAFSIIKNSTDTEPVYTDGTYAYFILPCFSQMGLEEDVCKVLDEMKTSMDEIVKLLD